MDCRATLGPISPTVDGSLAQMGAGDLDKELKCRGNRLLRGFENTLLDDANRLVGVVLSCVEASPDDRGRLRWGMGQTGQGVIGEIGAVYSQSMRCPDDQFLVQLAGFSGALGPQNPQVIDRFEIGCTSLQEDSDGKVVRSGNLATVEQTINGPVLDNGQIYEVARCPGSNMIGMIHATGKGHLDYLQVHCAPVLLKTQ